MEMTFSVKNLQAYFDKNYVLKNINLEIPRRAVTAIIGPSGCGKSTLLRCLNRMNDLSADFKMDGQVLLDGGDIYRTKTNVTDLRRRVGMVFQKPNPFPKSIYDNVAYGLKIQGERNIRKLKEAVRQSLQGAALWDEVKDALHRSALQLSGGQQQRLCIARTMAVEPEVVLFDEPCSALDPIATRKIEDLIVSLKGKYTIVVVTHNMQQARRIADYVAFLHWGELIEFGESRQVFENSREQMTRDYINGTFG